MKPILIAAIVMIVLGALALGYDYTYTTQETVQQIGPITAVAEKQHTVAFPAILGWLLIVAGVGTLVVNALSKKN